tara:strand:+ start:1921 stop:3708 length:1788 start_codon:yes stop_codon:yes gene_type:complete
MAESVRYQGRRVALRIPDAQAFEAQAIERGMGQLQQSLNRMTSFFAEQSRVQAKVQGEEFGAANAPTMEQILSARQTGEELKLPGDQNTLFGRAARQAAATVVASELELAAHKEMNATILDFENREANPAGLQDKLDAIILGYSSTFDESVPSMARSMKAKLALNAQTKYANYHSAYITNQKEKSKAAWIANSSLEFDNFPNLFKVGIVEKDEKGNEVTRPVNPKDIALFKFNKLNEMKNLGFSDSDINTWGKAYDSQILATASVSLSDTVLKRADAHKIIRRIQSSDIKGLPDNIAVPIAIMQNGDISLNDIARQLRTGLSEQINFENALEENNNKNTENNEEVFISRIKRAMIVGNTEEFKTALGLLRRTNDEKADELEKEFISAGMRRTESDPEAENYLIDLGDMLTIENVASVRDQLSNEDRVKYTNRADTLQDEETKTAVTIMRGRFELPEGYKPVSDQDPNFKKAMLFNKLIGRLNEKIETAKRQGKDIDAIAEVDLLIANVNEEFDEAFNAMQKEAGLNVLKPYKLYTDADLSTLQSGLTYLEQLRSDVLSQGVSAYPTQLRRGLKKVPEVIKLIDTHINGIKKALGQ